MKSRVGWENILAMQTYSDRFRAYRKVIHRVLGSKTVTSRFNALQDIEIRRFLLRVLQQPNDLVQHIRTYVVRLILVLYGANIGIQGGRRCDPQNRLRIHDRASWLRPPCRSGKPRDG